MHVKLFLLLNSFFETFTVVLTLKLRLRLYNLLFSLMTIPHLRISKTFSNSLDFFFLLFCDNYPSLRSSKNGNLQAVLFSSYLVHKQDRGHRPLRS